MGTVMILSVSVIFLYDHLADQKPQLAVTGQRQRETISVAWENTFEV